jgi:hypothetical protein
MPRQAPPALPVIALCFATLSLSTFSADGVARADTCLSAPGKAGPQGSHWYYRIERPSLRKCWHLVQDQKAQTAAKAAVEPDDEEATAVVPPAPAAIQPAKRLASPTPAPAPVIAPPIAAAPVPVIKNLVTRNVSNGDGATAPMSPPAEPADVPKSRAATEPATGSASAPVTIVQQPASNSVAASPPGSNLPSSQSLPATGGQAAATTANEQPVSTKTDKAAAASTGPTLGTLLGALALLGILTSALLFVLQMKWRREDVLNADWETAEAPTTKAPPVVPDAEDAPSFAPLPPMDPIVREDDDIERALQRFAQNIKRRAA